MPTFATVALDRLLQPGGSKSVDQSFSCSNPMPRPKFLPKTRSMPNSNLERRDSVPATKRKVNCPQISPALYATPKATPLPDSPSSFSPSPYIINHKRRGPRLLKSFSQADVAACRKALDEAEVNESAKDTENKGVDPTNDRSVTFAIADSVEGRHVKGVLDGPIKKQITNGSHHHGSNEGDQRNGLHDCEIGSGNMKLKSGTARNGLAMEKDVLKHVALYPERDGEPDDFFDPQDSMNYTSNTDGEDDSLIEGSAKLATTTPMGEFFDAWEELSLESGAPSLVRDTEAELNEMRLNLLMEIEKRKKAEETLSRLKNQWHRIRQQLSAVGLTLPEFSFTVPEAELLPDIDPAEELCRQVYLARFVSDSIGRGIAKAEAEMEKEAHIEAKNSEIARLWDRLYYYEAVSREMSQRNQEAVEMARRNRQVRKKRQQWLWGSIAAVISLGTTALAWSYLPAAKGSSSTSVSLAPEHTDAAK